MGILLNSIFKKEGLIILSITTIGYGVALAYENGYATYFSFDTEFIQIDIKAIFNGIISTSVFFLVAMVFITTFKQEKSNNIEKAAQIIICLLLIGTLSSPMTIKAIFSNLTITFAICIGSVPFFFIYNELAKKDKQSLPLLLGIFALYTISASTLVGIHKASLESRFNAFEYNNSEYVIIRNYNGNIVGIKLNGKELSHTENIYIPNAELKTLILKKVRIRSKPGTTNYREEYPEYKKNTLGYLLGLNKDTD